jgi:hypothetical protein
MEGHRSTHLSSEAFPTRSEQPQLGRGAGIFHIHIFIQNAYIFTWRKKDLMHFTLSTRC